MHSFQRFPIQRLLLAIFFSFVLACFPVHAQAPDDATQAEIQKLFTKGEKLFAAKDYAGAIPIFSDLRRRGPDLWGNDSQSQLIVEDYLAASYFSSEQYREAIPALKSVLAVSEKIRGKEDRANLAYISLLAESHLELRLYDEGLSYAERCVRLIEGNQKPDDGELVQALEQLAIFHGRRGHQTRQIEALTRSLKVRESSNVVDIAEVATALLILGRLESSNGDLEMAETHLVRSLNLREVKLGASHPGISEVLVPLARVKRITGDLQSASSDLRRALSIRKVDPGENSLAYADVLLELALLQSTSGHNDVAENMYQRAVRIHQTVAGKESTETAEALAVQGDFYLSSSRLAEALRTYSQALEIVERKAGHSGEELVPMLSRMANVHKALKQLDTAENLWLRTARIVEQKQGRDALGLGEVLISLADVRAKSGKVDLAEQDFRQMIETRIRVLGPGDMSVAYGLQMFGLFYSNQRRLADASDMFERSLLITEENKGKDHAFVAYALNFCAIADWEAGRHDKANEAFQRQIAIFEKVHGTDGMMGAHSIHNYAGFLAERGHYDEAVSLHERSRSIHLKAYGEGVAPAIDDELAGALAAAERWDQSMSFWGESLKGRRRSFLREVSLLSNSAQAAYLGDGRDDMVDRALTVALKCAGNASSRKSSAEWVVNMKALASEASRNRSLTEKLASEKVELKQLVQDLQALRTAEIRLAQRAENGLHVEVEERLSQSRKRQSEIEQNINAMVGSNEDLRRGWNELDEIRRALPADRTLIEFCVVRPWNFRAKGRQERLGEARYVAWVVTGGIDDIAIVDLGDAGTVDNAIRKAREAISAGAKEVLEVGEQKSFAAANVALEELSELLIDPLAPFLSKASSLTISPDGDLWLVPWAALPYTHFKMQRGVEEFRKWNEAEAKPHRFLVEDYAIQLVVSSRDLVRLAEEKVSETSAPLILADPDFDGSPSAGQMSLAGRIGHGMLGDIEARIEFSELGNITITSDGEVIGSGTWRQEGTKVSLETAYASYQGVLDGLKLSGRRTVKNRPDLGEQAWSVSLSDVAPSELRAVSQDLLRSARAQRLPGTAVEAELIAPHLAKLKGTEPKILSDGAALEAAFRSAVRPKALVLATHGYFLPQQEFEEKDDARSGLSDQKPKVLKTKSGGAWENPLLRCGLLLAGCNKRGEARPGEDDGVLTGLEIVGTDLRGTELVVLSACETGLGDVRVGDGVAGLRQAFQLAGAESVLASLWKVPDRETALLMSGFFRHLAEGKTRSEALREAQLELIKGRRERNNAAHPLFWAAFSITGNDAPGLATRN